MAKTFEVKLKRSSIGCTPTQKRTIEAVGLRKVNSVVTKTDTPANRGQLYKIQHLVEITVKK